MKVRFELSNDNNLWKARKILLSLFEMLFTFLEENDNRSNIENQ